MRERLSDGDLVAGRYEIRGPLAEGPAWLAYRALDRDIEVELALWWVRAGLFPDAGRRHRFMGAVVELRGLGHANLRRMFEAGEDGAGLWATAQLDGGAALPRAGEGPPLSAADLHALAAPIVAGLEAAHRAGQVHGRLVPEDLVRVASVTKVGGVGLFRDVDPAAARACWQGWQRYLAPEVVAGKLPTPASDVWSLAVMLAELGGGAPAARAAEALAAVRVIDRGLADALAGALVVAPERRLDGPAVLLARMHSMSAGPEDLVLPPSDDPLMLTEPEHAPALHEPAPDSWGDPIEEGEQTPAERKSAKLAGTWIGYSSGSNPAVRAPEEPEAAADSAVPLPLAAPPMTPVPPPRATTAPPVIAATVSHKPKTEPGVRKPTPVAPREIVPVLRPIATASPPPPSNLGRYAPARASGSQDIPPQGRRAWLWIGLAAGAAVVLIAVALILLLGRGGDDDDSDSPAALPPTPDVTPVDAAPPRPVAPPSPCPDGMVAIDEIRCIDAYESPGKGRMPEAGLPLAEALARCVSRGAQLCAEDEWERACRGADGASWPWGTAFKRGPCNLMGGGAASTGSFPECRSAIGAFDMSGNVAEWVAGGQIKGGSTDDGSDGRCSRHSKRPGNGAQGFADVGFRCCADARR